MQLFTRGRTADEDIYRRLAFDPAKNSLMEEIAQAKQEMDDAYNHFQNVSDPDLIDSCIYKGNAAWKRYQFLLRQAKTMQFGT